MTPGIYFYGKDIPVVPQEPHQVILFDGVQESKVIDISKGMQLGCMLP